MTRFGTMLTSTVVAALMSATPEAWGQSRGAFPRGIQEIRPLAAALHGTVDGVVVDDAGAPVAGATVSALGATSALAISDRGGRFALYQLPPGVYVVRAHFSGYVPSRRQYVEVRPAVRTNVSVSLHRSDRPRTLTAGLTPVSDGDTQAADDHGEVAWRLRHLGRSVLKDRTGQDDSYGGGDQADGDKQGGLVRAVASPARLASALFDGLPFTGQVNLLTAGSFDTMQRLFSSDSVSQNVASLSLHGPVGGWADWSFQGLTSQGDMGSWFVTGSLKSHVPASHVYDVSVAYSAKRSAGDPLMTLRPTLPQDNRAAGSVYAVDRWHMSPQVTLTYAGRYSRYDYLGGVGYLSPSAQLTLQPTRTVQIRTSASRHLLAPGAEEFLPPIAGGLWVPTERTFDWLSRDPMRAERANNYAFAIEHNLGGGYAITATTFYEEVQNQLVALFGAPDDGVPGSRYHAGTLGDVDARGWSVAFSNARNRRVHGSVTYQMTTARWHNVQSDGLLAVIAPSLIRSSERIHDVTTSIETELPYTSTRVFVLYRLDTAFSHGDTSKTPTLDARFDVQVTQPISMLDFTSAQWQVVFAVRNLFRESTAPGSVYDELLVVRPPKRLVGGLVVRF